MPTKITVAVGPNGEALNSKALRDGARADRIETESTTKQAKQFVAEEVDKLTQGRDNPGSKYKPSRDPAAFARKKKEKEEEDTLGEFCGLKIDFVYTALPRDVEWQNVRGAEYMDIQAKAITSKGLTTEQQSIKLVRNLNCETFAVYPKEGSYDDDLVLRTKHVSGYGAKGEAPWPGTQSLELTMWYVKPNVKFAVTNLEQSKNVIQLPGYVGLTQENWIRTFDDFTARNFMEFTTKAIGPLDGSTAFSQWERSSLSIFDDGERNYYYNYKGYPDDKFNFNISANGRTAEDSKTTIRSSEHLDPVYELFMLPYTAQKSFLLVTYTDYMIYDDCYFVSSCTATTEFAESADYRVYVYGAGYPRWYTGYINNIYWKRFKPEYNIPEGWRLENYDHVKLEFTDASVSNRPSPIITEKGSQVIQQVYLYSISDGVLSKVENVPQELRDAVAGLSANLKNFKVDSARRSAVLNYSEYEGIQQYVEPGSADPERRRNFGPVANTDTWTMADPVLNFLDDESVKTTVRDGRKYLAEQTRSRSMAKGYGFGRLSTNNHFDSKYIDKTLYGFADDYFFTPAVYDYIQGQGKCQTRYDLTTAPFGGIKFVDYDNSGKVRYTDSKPASISQSHDGPYGSWTTVPHLQGSTHRCWNWGKPRYCWDQLSALGFGPDLIGRRPAEE